VGTFGLEAIRWKLFQGITKQLIALLCSGDEIERISEFDPFTGEMLGEYPEVTIFPSREYISDEENIRQALTDIERELEERLAQFRKEDKLVEAQRLEQRIRYDLDMIREVGYTSGIENYSRHMEQRPAGSAPYTLLDYMPDDYLLVIDESHMTVPQLRGMYNGDRARKVTLVDYGFRLPSAMDNRPLKFDEIENRMGFVIYTSATPGPYEKEKSQAVVEQIIRPTGIVDPEVEVRPIERQVDDLLQEVAMRIKNHQRVLITTLTQRMAEEMAGYLNEMGIKAQYLHAEIDTLERVEILRDLRMGVYDVVVGINLLREGLDLPEVSLVAIMDADKEGFLRSDSALIQTIGRAARHLEGKVIMYADKITGSMERALEETNRRREIQRAYNEEHGIEPQAIVKQVRDLTDRVRAIMADEMQEDEDVPEGAEMVNLAELPPDRLHKMIKELEKEMKKAAQSLEFEKAAALRDQVFELRGALVEKQGADGDLLLS
jgi:excinuclease ABC subunit B